METLEGKLPWEGVPGAGPPTDPTAGTNTQRPLNVLKKDPQGSEGGGEVSCRKMG